MAYLDSNTKAGLHTVDMTATAQGLVAGERFERFKVEAMTEMALRIAGIVMVMGSVTMWFFLPVDPETGRLAAHGMMASLMALAGLGVFVYGTRGFRRRMTLDMQAGKLTLTKINMHDQARVSRVLDLGAIESIFLRRPAHAGGMATLLVRVAGKSAPAIALSGEIHEIEEVHAELCAVLKGTSACAVRKPSLRISDGPERPRRIAA
ncbi:hypothetical protein FIU86_14790 [Roseovarius sp. THAF9]|uniref:hypothetical protein n=1 Tax=Roseovarius sp. THAF9 TaxID=2587847 RepID=UPI00126856E7|nr:hypothetical protein [Roseovarius sp. THAF9]QFT94115.1 hypothetical protein FIU86_14790 [Roseovarius sp. THAF9]